MSKNLSAFITRNINIRNGKPVISGTGVTVQRIATWYNLGHSPEEITSHLPHLSLTKVFVALAYYFDRKNEFDAEIEKERKEADAIETELLNSSKFF